MAAHWDKSISPLLCVSVIISVSFRGMRYAYTKHFKGGNCRYGMVCFFVFFLISQNLIPFICGNMEACCLRAMLSVCWVFFWSNHFCVSGVVIQLLGNTKFGRWTVLETSLRVQGGVLWQGTNLVQAWLTTFICFFFFCSLKDKI